jgi:hypothetical protein
MLKTFLLTFKFHRFSQSGFYFDFFYKKFAEVFVRNVFVYTAQFLGEKYMIEVLTKKTFDSVIYNTNKILGWQTLHSSWFFLQFISFIFYFLFFLGCVYLFI